MENDFLKLGANNIRVLSADAVQKANSGHPGMPLGSADFGFVLWYKYLRHNPLNPEWLGRDRFVLSAGHGSMLLYSLLYLFEYGLSLDEIKNFRQWGSLTPGHPEYHHTKGVDITTGPLGSGFSSAVGMAIAAKNFIARVKLEDVEPYKNQKIYVMCGDGCLMEGCSHESGALAGHLKLDNIICFYDSNSITIEGATSLATSENTGERFEAYGWRVLKIADANDVEEVDAALEKAQKTDGRPTLIIGKTKIGFGAPNKQGKSSTHGEPLGVEEVLALKKNIGFPPDNFYVNEEVKAKCHERVLQLAAQAVKLDDNFNSHLLKNSELAKLASSLIHKTIPENLIEELKAVTPVEKPTATRASSHTILQQVSKCVPALIGGAADLAPSTKSNVVSESDFTSQNREGRNLHFGIREFGMGLAINGMALYGVSIPYGSTFLVFSDYLKPALRLASLQKLHIIYIFTHDSFYVGEDGPTHEPIEQITMLRSIPGVTVLRPAEATETAYAWETAIKADSPVCLLLTRQNLDPLPKELAKNINVSKGAYILQDEKDYDVLFVATGSEVNLALKTAAKLKEKEIRSRVVSMPSMELFFAQDESYRESVIPSTFKAIVSIEAGSTLMWKNIVGSTGLTIGIDHFGASAPSNVLEQKFGFDKDQVAEKVIKHFKLKYT